MIFLYRGCAHILLHRRMTHNCNCSPSLRLIFSPVFSSFLGMVVGGVTHLVWAGGVLSLNTQRKHTQNKNKNAVYCQRSRVTLGRGLRWLRGVSPSFLFSLFLGIVNCTNLSVNETTPAAPGWGLFFVLSAPQEKGLKGFFGSCPRLQLLLVLKREEV